MYCNEKLPVMFLEEVDQLKHGKEAYRSMILLDDVPDPVSASLSEAKRRLHNRNEELQKQKINSPHIPAFEETTVFLSLALLWNLFECQELGFEVTGSADGAANMVANDLKFLNFGHFIVSDKGQKSF